MAEYKLDNDLFEENMENPDVETRSTKEIREMFSQAQGVANSLLAAPTCSQDTIYLPSGDHHLYAIDFRTGKIIWKFLTGAIVAHSPVVHKGVVYFGSTDYNLYALDIADGKERWHFRTGDMVNTMPLVLEDRIIFGSFDNYIYALTHDGEEIWKLRFNGIPQGQPLLINKTLFIGATDGRIHAINMDGKELWSHYFGDTGVASPSYFTETNSLLFTTWDGYAHRMTLDGRIIWDYYCGGCTPVRYPWEIDKNVYYVGSGDFHTGGVYALDASTGRLIWKFQTGGRVQGAHVFDNKIICTSMEGKVTALDKNGSIIWTFQADGSIQQPAIEYNGLLFIASWNGHFYCIDENGELVWTIYFPGQPGDLKQVFSPIQRISNRVRAFLNRWKSEKPLLSAYDIKSAQPQLTLGSAAYRMKEPYKPSGTTYQMSDPYQAKKKDWRDLAQGKR